MTGIERFLQIVDADIEIFDEPDAVDLSKPMGNIAFDKVKCLISSPSSVILPEDTS